MRRSFNRHLDCPKLIINNAAMDILVHCLLVHMNHIPCLTRISVPGIYTIEAVLLYTSELDTEVLKM